MSRKVSIDGATYCKKIDGWREERSVCCGTHSLSRTDDGTMAAYHRGGNEDDNNNDRRSRPREHKLGERRKHDRGVEHVHGGRGGEVVGRAEHEELGRELADEEPIEALGRSR